MMAKENIIKNIEWITSLRAIACILVIMIHVIDGWGGMANSNDFSNFRSLFDNLLIQPFIRIGVPIFIMISGCLLLNPNKEVRLDKIKKYIMRMIYILMSFGLFYCIIEIVISKNYSNFFEIFYRGIFNLLEEKSWGHMWYIYMLIGIYIVTPIIRKYISKTDISTQKFILIALFILSLLIPTINSIFEIELTSFKLSALKYVCVYMFGYYIVYTDIIKAKYLYIGGIIGFIGYIACIYFFNYHSQTSIFIVLVSALVLYLFYKNKIKIKNNNIINNISNYSLGIYIVHAFWLNVFYKGFNFTPDILPPIIGELFFLIITLILSLVSSIILYRIPIIKKCFK